MLPSEKSGEGEVIRSASFSVSARVAMQLGRESISNSIVGILELIKNAYDADAENVTLHFSDLDSDQATLVIDDDGHGMTEQALVENWLVIGTDNKLRSGQSRRKKRVLTGEKGLGRLGLDRLCRATAVQSFTGDSETGIQLDVDWEKYEDTTQRLETIQHPISRIPSKLLRNPTTGQLFTKAHGTRLILSGLKDSWTSGPIDDLCSELSLLVSPFAGPEDFSINVYARGKRHTISSTEIIEAAEWKLQASISDTGNLAYKMTGQHGEEYVFDEPWRSVFTDRDVELPRCGPLEMAMYFIPRRRVEGLSFTTAQISAFMNANQGIRIYRDEFRVKPYGGPAGEGDWLNLAYRRTQSPGGRSQTGWRVGYNQVIGAVFIKRDRNEALLDQTNREGIVDGEAFSDLRAFALHAIDWFERKQVDDYCAKGNMSEYDQIAREAETAKTHTRSATSDLERAAADVNSALDSPELPGEGLVHDGIKSKFSDAVSALKENVEESIAIQDKLTTAHDEMEQNFERKSETLHNLASLGILAVAFGHETLSHTNLLAAAARLLKDRLTPSVLKHVDEKAKSTIQNSINDIAYASKRIRAYGAFMLRNMRRDKRTRRNVYIDKVIGDIFKSFALEETRSVCVKLDFPQHTPPIRAFIVDWESIFVNLLTNAVWALQPVHNREIRVRIREIDGRLNIWFADSGRGISKGTIDHIFEPAFSTKRNERGDKIGTGMGLAIVEDLVKSYSGNIHVSSPSDLGGAEFHIVVPLPQTPSGGSGNGAQ